MEDEWYYGIEGVQAGPITGDELKRLAASGRLRPTDLVWQEGMDEWAAAARVGWLFPPASSPSRPAARGPDPVPPRGTARPGGVVWHLLVLGGAGLMAIAIVLPWWGVRYTLDPGRKGSLADLKRLPKVMKESEAWGKGYVGEAKYDRFVGDYAEYQSASLTVWGWHTLPAVLSLLTGVLAAAVGTAALLVRAVRDWAWAGQLLVMLLAIPCLVLSLVFVFSCPTETIDGLIAQGFGVGPFLAAAASVLVVVFAGIGGVRGLIAFAPRGNRRPPAP